MYKKRTLSEKKAKTKLAETKVAPATPPRPRDKSDTVVEDKLRALFQLQMVDSKIDSIRTIRGELPLEVQDLEDEVQGLETRVTNFTTELKEIEQQVSAKKNIAKESEALIKKYEAQKNKVRNNREFDSISKEIEFQKLEIQLSEKRIKEYKANIYSKKEVIEQSTTLLNERKSDLQHKKAELDDIIAETQKDEEGLLKKSKQAESVIDPRLLNAYKRIRKNARNGLAVVAVGRDACGGCFNQIPPQRQLDIRTHKKVIVCEYCGRVLVDAEILQEA